MPKYIQWYSIKDQDARRASGVRLNVSRWHIESKANPGHSLCGKVVWIRINGTLIKKPICKVCEKLSRCQ